MDLITATDWWVFAGIAVLAGLALVLSLGREDAPDERRRRLRAWCRVGLLFLLLSAVWAALYAALLAGAETDLPELGFWGVELCLAALFWYLALRPRH